MVEEKKKLLLLLLFGFLSSEYNHLCSLSIMEEEKSVHLRETGHGMKEKEWVPFVVQLE